MAHSDVVSPISPPTRNSASPAVPDQEWGRLLREAAAPAGAPQATMDDRAFKGDQFDLDGQVQNLQREITRMLNEYRTLSQTTGEARSYQQSQINMLMTMIASLGRKITTGGSVASPETRQVYGMMSSLQSELEAQRARSRSEGATAGMILGQMQGLQGNLERALAQILQQLSALHMRMSSLV
jgi:hypothetical protein